MADKPLFDEERRALQRLRWYMLLRWAGVAVLYTAGTVSREVGALEYSQAAANVLAPIVLVYNFAVWWTIRRWRTDPPENWRRAYALLGNSQCSADLLVLAIALHFSGGIESWSGGMSQVAVLVVAGLVLTPLASVGQGLFACVLFDSIVIAEATGFLDHVTLGTLQPERVTSARYVAAVIVTHNTTVLFIVALVVYLADRLRRREAELAHLYRVEREAVQRLEELDRLKGDFLAAVSHELRTPLTSIVGFANNLRHRWSSTAEAAKVEQIGVIERQSMRLRRLVEDLLDFSSIESGNLDVRPQRVAVKNAVVTAVEKSEVGDVEIDVPDDLYVHADPRRVEQAIINLVDNAHKYGQPPVRVVATAQARSAIVAVEDAGTPIPEHLRDALFERFRQLDGGITRTSSGVGLGLALVKGYVEAQGGEAWYEADGATGATSRFCFTLPLY